MGLVCLQGPATKLLSLSEAKAWLRVDSTDEDLVIESLILAATAYLDGPMGILGSCLREQTWRLDLPSFPPTGGICLPGPPTIAVDSITYYDAQGTQQTLATTVYRAIERDFPRSWLVWLDVNQTWPATLVDVPDAVSVTYRAGRVSASSPENEAVPETIRVAALMLVGAWFENRTVDESKIRAMIAPFRIIPVA